MQIGKHCFQDAGKTYVMGILNVTPDSFSDGGTHNLPDMALRHAERMIAQGADVIDIGGESTRPGAAYVSAKEEIARVVPVIQALKAHFDTPLSLDTYKGIVAEAGLEAGIDLINDVWGLKKDPYMGRVLEKYPVPVCIMHNREKGDYGDFKKEIFSDLWESLEIASAHGIGKERIILDPGIGFAKTLEQNLWVMKHLEDFHRFGCGLLLGTSRKSMIGKVLDLPVDQREEGTLVTSILAAQQGYSWVRVHNVEGNKRGLRMLEAIWQS